MSDKRIANYTSGIRVIGTDSAIETVCGALDALKNKSETAHKLITEVGSLNTYHGRAVEIYLGPFATNCKCDGCLRDPYIRNCFNWELNAIVYDPTEVYSKKTEWSQNLPPELSLGHELVHAYHWIKGKMWVNVNYITHPAHKYMEEMQTVGIGAFKDKEFTENAIRCDYGLPLRTEY